LGLVLYCLLQVANGQRNSIHKKGLVGKASIFLFEVSNGAQKRRAEKNDKVSKLLETKEHHGEREQFLILSE